MDIGKILESSRGRIFAVKVHTKHTCHGEVHGWLGGVIDAVDAVAHIIPPACDTTREKGRIQPKKVLPLIYSGQVTLKIPDKAILCRKESIQSS